MKPMQWLNTSTLSCISQKFHITKSALCFCMSEVITGVCFSYVVSLCDFAYYVFGKEPAVAMHLALWYVLLVCHQYDVCKNSVGSVYLVGMVV